MTDISAEQSPRPKGLLSKVGEYLGYPERRTGYQYLPHLNETFNRINALGTLHSGTQDKTTEVQLKALKATMRFGHDFLKTQMKEQPERNFFSEAFDQWLRTHSTLTKNFPVQFDDIEPAVTPKDGADTLDETQVIDAMTDRAARLTAAALEFRKEAQAGTLQPTEKITDENGQRVERSLNTSQYEELFGRTRLPGKGIDKVHKALPDSKHIILSVQDANNQSYFYKLNVYEADGTTPLSPGAIKAAMQEAQTHVLTSQDEQQNGNIMTFPYGTLMYLPVVASELNDAKDAHGKKFAQVDSKKNVYKALLHTSKDNQNKKSFDEINNALFTVSLDRPKPGGYSDESEAFAQIRDGNGDYSNNRTPNKAFNFIVTYDEKTGKVLSGNSQEHSSVDGSVAMEFNGYVAEKAKEMDTTQNSSSHSHPQVLQWNTNGVGEHMEMLKTFQESIPQRRSEQVGVVNMKFTAEDLEKNNLRADLLTQLAVGKTAAKANGNNPLSIMFPANTRGLKDGRLDFAEMLTQAEYDYIFKPEKQTKEGARAALDSLAEKVKDLKTGKPFLSHLMAINAKTLWPSALGATELMVNKVFTNVAEVLTDASVSSNGGYKKGVKRFGTAQSGIMSNGYFNDIPRPDDKENTDQECKFIFDLVVRPEQAEAFKDFQNDIEEEFRKLHELLVENPSESSAIAA